MKHDICFWPLADCHSGDIPLIFRDRILNVCFTQSRTLKSAEYHHYDSLLTARSRRRASLAALREAIDAGWRSLWWYYLEHDKNLDSIRDEPEFKAMVEEVRADIAAQLMRLREAKASGELAPIPKSLE